eukprot:scaffold20295_cov58-Phaeocystis_antarctica.AAC.6
MSRGDPRWYSTTRAPSVSGVIGWVLAARRAPPNVTARIGSMVRALRRIRYTPCDPTATMREPSTSTTRAPARAERVGCDWAGLGTAQSASPLQGAHTSGRWRSMSAGWATSPGRPPRRREGGLSTSVHHARAKHV